MGLREFKALQLANRYIGVECGYVKVSSCRTHTDFYLEYGEIYNIFTVELDGLTTRSRFMKILTCQHSHRQVKISCGVLDGPPADNESRVHFTHAMDEGIQKSQIEPAVTSLKELKSTALHGHINEPSSKADTSLTERLTPQVAVKLQREQRPEFWLADGRIKEINRVFDSLATRLDALLALCDNASPAHLNNSILAEQERLLVSNIARTISVFIDLKVCP